MPQVRSHARLFFHTTLAVVSLALAVGLGLAACSDRSASGPVDLRFWYAWGGYEGKFLESLIQEFNDTHPHIRVKGSFFNIGDKLLASIAGGKPPDVATVWDYMLGTMGEAGCFLPLEDRLRAAQITPEAYLPHIWDYGMVSRHKWGVPTTLNAMGIYYNKTFAREAGLDPEHPPQTIDELTSWAKKLLIKNPDGTIQRIGFAPVTAHCYFWNFGGGIWDTKTRTFTLDRPENLRALEWMKSMYDPVGYSNWSRFMAGFGRLDSPQNPFIVGKVAMREDGQWAIQFINEYDPEKKVDYGVMCYPSAIPGRPGVTSVVGSFWVIPQGTKHPDEAWEFLHWLILPEQSARFCARLRNIPPLRATVERPEFQEVCRDPKFKAFVDMILEGRGRTRPALPVGQELEDKLSFQIDVALSGRVPAAKYLQDFNRDITKKLDIATKLLSLEGD